PASTTAASSRSRSSPPGSTTSTASRTRWASGARHLPVGWHLDGRFPTSGACDTNSHRRTSMTRSLPRTALAFPLALVTGLPPLLPGAAQEPAADDQTEAAPGDAPQWPRVIEAGDTTFSIYQPQIDKFSDAVLEARAAVQVETKLPDDKKQTTYGVIWIKANT